jgi:uncharacterized protein YjaG (DUF416 family)
MTEIMMVDFNEDKLREELSILPVNHRIAFAASCCERLMPNYMAFYCMEKWGDPAVLRRALNEVWDFLTGTPLPVEKIKELTQECIAQAPDTEDFTSLFTSAAGDASAAIAYALESCIDGNEECIALIGRLPTETLYQYLSTVNDPLVGSHIADPAFEEWIAKAPLIIVELEKQQQDLAILKSHTILEPDFLNQLRQSSAAAGLQPFGRGLLRTSEN